MPINPIFFLKHGELAYKAPTFHSALQHRTYIRMRSLIEM